MSSNREIRDAVRQLGRAVGTLVRAVAGAVRRTGPTAAEPATESGPPQEWLDIAAETDPDWLARSRWTSRARHTGEESVHSSGDSKRATSARTAPSQQQSPTEGSWPDVVPRESQTASMRRPGRATDDEATQTAAQQRRDPGTEPQLRRLLPVHPAGDADRAHDDPPRRVRPTGPDESTAHDGQRLESGRGTPAGSARLARADRPLDGGRDTADAAVREQAPPRPYTPSDTLRPVTLQPRPTPTSEPVRPEPEHRGPASQSSSLPAHVRELPRTWTPAPGHGPRPAPVPSELQTAAWAPSWPELPRTEGLDDAHAQAGPGLVAQLWQADDRPDALTAAQRRT
jgi:hypothetical protein